MLTITVAVGLLPLVSITVDAAGYELPYIIALGDEVYVSNGVFILAAEYSKQTDPLFIDSVRSLGDTTIRIVYSSAVDDWVTDEIITSSKVTTSSEAFYRYGESTKYSTYTVYTTVWSGIWTAIPVVTNVSWNDYEIAATSSYTNDLTQLPQGITEDDINRIIDQQLNTQTAAGQAAQTIINNTTNNYNLYLTGDITSTDMQSYVTDNLDTLSDLTPSTLLDAMQINNALTYNQSIQDKLNNTVSSEVQQILTQYITNVNADVYEYRQGNASQQTTVNRIRSRVYDLQKLIDNGTISTTADILATQAALTTIQTHLDSVTGYSDVSRDASDKSQASDQAELDFLDELTAETTASVTDIAPSKVFTTSQTGEAQEVLDLIWENEFVKRLLPMCAGFMVVCVVLGIRYKV